jgi:hypothetical protein
MQSIQTLEKATKECTRLRIELVEFEKRVKDLQASLHNIEWELHSNNCQSPLHREDRLVTRIEEVCARVLRRFFAKWCSRSPSSGPVVLIHYGDSQSK